MGKINFTLLPKFIFGILAAVLIALNRLPSLPFYENDGYKNDVSTLLIVCLGGVIPFDGIAFYEIVIALIPLVSQMIFFSEFISSDFDTISVYVFSRTKKRDKWLFKRMLLLTGISFAYSMTLVLTVIAVGGLNGLLINYNILTAIALLFFTMFIWSALFVNIIAVFSLKIKTKTLLSISITVFTTWIFSVNFIPTVVSKWLAPIIPITHELLASHSNIAELDFLANRIGERNYLITMLGSNLYFIICLVVFILISRYFIMRTDFTQTR
ncbi:MAG: hypothetical protein LBM93_11935 [Oscillospiraceae bacterium]|jgi:hypothetical protein|nr:hypothetical protein [Oscillospiraceae bacterium]